MLGDLRVKSSSGFTLLELLAVIIVVGVLGAVLLGRVWFYQEQAEKVAMEQMAGTLRSALHLQIADRLLKGQPDFATLADDNPMEWLMEPPKNYLGERFGAMPGAVAGGNWYFDLQDKTLIYVVAQGAHFTPNSAGHKRVRYQVRPIAGRKNIQVGLGTVDKQNIEGVVLVLLEPYQWFGR